MSKSPLLHVIETCRDDSQLWNEPDFPFQATIHAGHPRVVFMAGPNASGKSFFTGMFQTWGKAHHQTNPINVSMNERTGADGHDFGGMRRQMMFGNESKQSTGMTSVSVTERALHNLKCWSEDGHYPLLVLDEPDLGLAEGYCDALGRMIGQELAGVVAGERPPCGALIISHSKALARGLIAGLGAIPSFVHTGEHHALDLGEWLALEPTYGITELKALHEKSSEMRRTIMSLIRPKSNPAQPKKRAAKKRVTPQGA